MMAKKSILFILIALFLTGCNELENYKEDALELWKNGAGDKYSIHMFRGNGSYSKESERIITLNKYEKFDAIYSHRYIEGDTSIGANDIDYLKAWDEKEYPFYLIVSKGGIALKTTSVNDIEKFFEKNGGQLKGDRE